MRIQFLGLEFPQPVLKTAKTLQFGIERKPAEIIRPAIVFMETKPGCKKRARVQVTFDELFATALKSASVFCAALSAGTIAKRMRRRNRFIIALTDY